MAELTVSDSALVPTELEYSAGNHSGTAPGDRRFRPDVEGLRAVAVALVVLYHAGIPRLTGGFVGVDVFFVISGFVITGVLLREREGSGTTSFFDFYARRVRRILPAATLVIVVVVLATYVALGFITGNNTANDGRWAAVFLSNFHFASVGTSYLESLRPPSPLQNYWSLSVEEQFYAVYPLLFVVVARSRGKGRPPLHGRLVVALTAVVAASFWWSVVQTSSNPAVAYFSPFTRAWELSAGALVAVGTVWLRRLPIRWAAVLSWAGLGAILYSAFAFNSETAYPGSLVAIPVCGAALVIGGGVVAPTWGAEAVLGLRPFRWLGKLSYSLYLWHWPILIIVAENTGRSRLPVDESLALITVALGLSWVTFRLIENPIRHVRLPSRQSVLLGLILVAATVVLLTALIAGQTTTGSGSVSPAPNDRTVLARVAAAPAIVTLPHRLTPSLSGAPTDWGGRDIGPLCQATAVQSRVQLCILGDPAGTRLMVLYGDSHAVMWVPAFDGIAKAAHWQLIVLSKTGCPPAMVTIGQPTLAGRSGRPYVDCDKWHRWATREIKALHPNVLVVSEDNVVQSPSTAEQPSRAFTSGAWMEGLDRLFRSVPGRETRRVFLGSTPILPQSAPACLAAHLDDVQVCSAPVRASESSLDAAERSAAQDSDVQYIDPTPWFCSTTCTAIVDRYVVYLDRSHITSTYATFLEIVLGRALDLGGSR